MGITTILLCFGGHSEISLCILSWSLCSWTFFFFFFFIQHRNQCLFLGNLPSWLSVSTSMDHLSSLINSKWWISGLKIMTLMKLLVHLPKFLSDRLYYMIFPPCLGFREKKSCQIHKWKTQSPLQTELFDNQKSSY